MSRILPHLRRWPRVVLLFSGGLDSSLLLAAGQEALGEGLTALTFSGPQTAPGEVAAAWQLTRRYQVRHLLATFDPLHLPDFRGNTPQRCYFCKQAMLVHARQVAADLGAEAIWDGTNLDDLQEFRPGLQAVQEAGVESPWVSAGLGKQAIRELSRRLGLPDQKAPQSCLATRFPYNTPLTREDLARVGRAEAWLKARGLAHVRLRVRGWQARLELTAAEWPLFWGQGLRRPFRAYLNSLGFEDLELAVPG
jgi:pyridinium-3,5-biscarboxylic acid mononucleotide sulfurtransferase